MTSYEKGFFYLAEAYANQTIPEDEGQWEFVGPPDCDHSIDEILDHLTGSDVVMSSHQCRLLNLPEGSSYGAGVGRISNDTARRSPEALSFHARATLPLSTPKGESGRGRGLSARENPEPAAG